MEKLNFKSFKFLTEKDKKALTFLYSVMKKNIVNKGEEFNFPKLFNLLINKHSKNFSIYEIYKYSFILRYYLDLLENDEPYFRDIPEEEVTSEIFFDQIIKYIFNSEKFKDSLKHLEKSFSVSNDVTTCFIDLEEFQSERGMIYSYSDIKCTDNSNNEVVHRRVNSFFINIDIENFNELKIKFNIYELKDHEFIVPQPWGNIKNISIEGMSKLVTETLKPYYNDFFESFLDDLTYEY